MPNIQIVTDTGHNLPDTIRDQIPMIECPFRIHVGDDTLLDNSPTLAEIATLLERRKGSYPKTAAPNFGDFIDVYKACQKKDGILVVTIGSSFSATHSNSVVAVELFREETGSDLPIEVVDSRGGTMTQGFLIMEALQLISAGKPLQFVATVLREQANQGNLVFALRETTYLYRSGRAKRYEHLLGSILRIKPVLALSNGELALLDRVRGRGEHKALARVVQEVIERSGGKITKLAVIGGIDTEKEEKEVKEQILARLSSEPTQIIDAKICPAIMVNVGPHSVGAAWV